MLSMGSLTQAMIDYYGTDTRRIGHFLKVYGFASAIGALEGLSPETQEILGAAALTHDIGIKISEEKYGCSDGKYQELEGPVEAKKMLSALGAAPELIDRVCFLIAHHHTYTNIEGIDYQILIEADFLVNADEDALSDEAIRAFGDRIFKTKSGSEMLHAMYISCYNEQIVTER